MGNDTRFAKARQGGAESSLCDTARISGTQSGVEIGACGTASHLCLDSERRGENSFRDEKSTALMASPR